jgi:hypothetical protein
MPADVAVLGTTRKTRAQIAKVAACRHGAAEPIT